MGLGKKVTKTNNYMEEAPADDESEGIKAKLL